MTKREKMLLAGVIGVIALWGGWRGLSAYQGALADRRSELRSLERDLSDARLEQALVDEAIQNLESWQERSLPTNLQVAQSEYRGWLVERLSEAGLSFDNVRRVSARPVANAYTAITYLAHAEGDLDQVTRFLHTFYSSRLLHKLTLVRLAPLSGSGKLGLDITVEALIVEGAVRKEGIVEGQSDRLAHSGVEDYLDSIGARNLFVPYTPPPPPRPKPEPRVVVERPPPPPKFDDSKHAYISGVVGDAEGPQAWLNVRTTGETLYLRQGDPFEVGQFQGRVLSINVRDKEVVLESDGQVLKLELGSHLREAKPAG